MAMGLPAIDFLCCINLGDFRPEKINGFGIHLEFFIMIWSLIRKEAASDGNGCPVIDFLCCGVSQQQQVLRCYSDIKSMPPCS